VENRRFNRAPIHRTVRFALKIEDDAFSEGLATDISLGGMFVASDAPALFGAEILIHMVLSDGGPEFVLPAIVRWTRSGGMGVQFRLLGARETLAITEIVKVHEESA
jgi:Tfp pilus assembly protein PilZ